MKLISYFLHYVILIQDSSLLLSFAIRIAAFVMDLFLWMICQRVRSASQSQRRTMNDCAATTTGARFLFR